MSIEHLLVAIFLLIFGCAKKEKPTEPAISGRLVVRSTPAGAQIVVDGRGTGKVTPDSIEISAGRHLVKVYLLGYKSDSSEVNITGGKRAELNFELVPVELYGSLFVESFPPGARIIVDYQPLGISTPDTIELPAGAHILTLELENFTMNHPVNIDLFADSLLSLSVELQPVKSVLVEYFGNVSCQGCELSARFLHAIHLYFGKSVSLVSYHTRFPSPIDPFYTYNPADNQARVNFYSVGSLPSVFVDGSPVADPTDSALVANEITRRLGALAELGFVGAIYLEQESLNFHLDIYGYGNFDGNIYAVLVEDSVHFDTPPGTNGETEFFASMRRLVDLGTLSLIRGQHIEKTSSFPFAGSSLDKFSIIVFAQKSSKEVIQSASFK